MSELLPLLFTKEQPWATCSSCPLQKSNGSNFLFSKSELEFRSFAHKKRTDSLEKQSKFLTLRKAICDVKKIIKINLCNSSMKYLLQLIRQNEVEIYGDDWWRKELRWYSYLCYLGKSEGDLYKSKEKIYKIYDIISTVCS